ncbi:T9SS type A sorting domain-containing protein [Polaribacter pectinis]|uniref:Aminopeptidase N n=1 Tax=Polaribacter pectinis TaxID=2738844 RepID=A0A7G9L8Y3_9FLAO|nr:M1 family aminopeptidase [Polaribacter pectinis]QNM85082.1 T9SS type A sorting domain-containing protein [Polaribacter pectinis]
MIRFVVFLFFVFITFTNTTAQEIQEISEAEAKSATSKIHFRANPNTSNYDVTYHKLEFTVDPSVASISGKVTTTFTAKEDLTTVTFDLDDNMIVTKVSENGNPLSYSQNANDELVITLQNTLLNNNSTSVSIEYNGNPTSNGFGSFEVNTHNGTPVLWTLSEPYGALGWWPCKQDLNDKIDVIDVYITAPQQYVSVSNGLEQSTTVNAGNKTTHFKHQYPIPAYLIAIAVTNYQTYSHTVPNNGNPFPIVNYVYPESLTSAQNSTGVTVDIMNHFIDLFGNYPFENEKYGHAQFGWGGGMEHTTVSFMGSFNRGLIAHELAHQWFGNKITCGSWKDIWLNEGFATFLSGLTIEHLDGEAGYQNWRSSRNNSITSVTNGAVYLSDADTTSVNRIFSSRLSYNKGAMVLHMLRKKLGDTNFFSGLKNYITDPNLAYNYAKTPDFIAHMETSSGLQLDEFFNDWIYNQGYPSYNLGWNQTTADKINITVNQTQSHSSVSFFEANVPVRIKGTNGEVLDVVLDNTTDGQVFTENVSFTVSSVEFDPESHLISRDNTVLSVENQNFIEKNISIFPNPITDILNVKITSNIEIKNTIVYNMLGKKVLQSKNTEIDLKQLNSGVYFIKISTNSGNLHQKIIKK